MRVFLSWSGTISRNLANALHGWIPLVIQSARPFISTGDIEKGRRWSDVLGDELSTSSYGIVCVTRDNCNAPWLHFEAGAISKAIDKSYVSPLLFDIEPSEIQGPLSQFQLTVCTKEDILNLMRSINSRLDDEQRLSDNLLTSEFERWWPDLMEKLQEVRSTKIDETHTVFDWLYTTADLMRAHRTKAQTCIWWITPNPFEYVLASSLRESIRECIQRGVTFTVIIPTSERSEDAKPVFRHIAPDKPDNIKIVEIPSDEFHRAAVTDYVVVNPEADSMEVFLELPVAERGYWINVVDAESAGGFAARFRVLAQQQGKDLSRLPAGSN